MSNKKRLNVLVTRLLLLASVFVVSRGMGAVIYVDGNAPGTNNGSSWTDAFHHLQDALADAMNGDEIWVAEGTYRPDESRANPDGTGSRDATFKLGESFNPDKKNLVLKGGYAGFGEPAPDARDVESYVTVLSGDLEMNDANVSDPCDLPDEPTRVDNSMHILNGAYSGEPVLDGFTITGGRGNYGGGIYISQDGSLTVKDCTFTANSANSFGGAIYSGGYNAFIDAAAYLTIMDCRFHGNFAGWDGGAIELHGGVCVLSGCEFQANKCAQTGGAAFLWCNSVIVADCVFHENATLDDPLNANNGGALHLTVDNLEVRNSAFTHNYAENYGGAVNWGGGIDGTSIFENCIFRENRGGGGGAASLGPGATTLNNCSFIDNDGSGSVGGALDNSNGSLTIAECNFTGNITDQSGGAIFHRTGDLSVTDCSFRNNSSGNAGGAIRHKWGRLAMEDSSFIGNRAGRSGGGAVHCLMSDITASRCHFSGNVTAYLGGAVRAESCGEVILRNCILSGNSAYQGGGMMLEYSGPVTLTNCTFANNSAVPDGGGLRGRNSNSTMTNCIFWGNSASYGPQIVLTASNSAVSYSDVQGGEAAVLGDTINWGSGNSDADPLFVNPGYWDSNSTPGDDSDDFWVAGDYRLLSGSPCIDAADGDVATETDILNNTRHDDPGTGNTGTGNPKYVDIGSYEFQGTNPPAPVTVPNAVGLSQASAQSAMTAAGLVVGNVTTAYSNTVAAGNVISQSPAGGSSVVIGSAVDLVISDGPPPPAILLAKCKVKAGKTAGKDSISFTGTMDITKDELANAGEIYIAIVSDVDGFVVYSNDNDPLIINQAKVKKGKYSHRDKQKGISFKIDTKKGKFALKIKNANLTGLGSPLSLEIVIGSYYGAGSADESKVNGPKKSIPIQLMSGYKDTLPPPLKIKAKNGKKEFTDSLAVKGGFSLKDEPSPITSVTLSLGNQPFDITDDAGTFTYKRDKKTSKIKTIAYKTDKGVMPQIKAKFDFIKCSYSVSIKKAELDTTSGQTTFGVLIDMSLSDSDYNESVPVHLN